MKKNHKIYCNVIRRLVLVSRRNLLITQKELSDVSGLTRQFISLIESGKRVPSFENFCLLAKGLKKTPTEFMAMFDDFFEQECQLE